MDATTPPAADRTLEPFRARVPPRLWLLPTGSVVGGLLLLMLSVLLWPSSARGGLAVGAAGFAALITGTSILRHMLKLSRVLSRVGTGLCPECGFNLGGNFDAPCPVCYPDGDPNFLHPKATEEEKRIWLARQPRSVRRLIAGTTHEIQGRTLSLRPMATLDFQTSPRQEPDGSVVFVETGRSSAAVWILLWSLMVLAGGGLSAAGVIVAWEIWRDAGAAALGSLCGIVPGLMVLWLMYRARAHGRKVRTLTIDPPRQLVIDERRTSRHVETSEAPLEACHLFCPEILTGHGTLYGVFFWGPQEPFPLAVVTSDAEVGAYLEQLPEWLRALEKPDPAFVRLVPRPRQAWSPEARRESVERELGESALGSLARKFT